MRNRAPRSTFGVAALVLQLVGCSRADPYGLDCVLRATDTRVECPRVDRITSRRPSLSDPGELMIDGVRARRDAERIELTITLHGRFSNEADQNLYVFLGAAGGHGRYALSADDEFLSDANYPIRGALALNGSPDLRLGLMAPAVAPHSPQLYRGDDDRTLLVGPDAHVVLEVVDHEVRCRLPLVEHYQAIGRPAPERLAITVATARDYVGFVDSRSIDALTVGAESSASAAAEPPARYPPLDLRSHELKAIALSRTPGGLQIELATAAPITDWAQTNLAFFLFAHPPARAPDRLLDPSHTTPMPYAWTSYCAVYSPSRIFCKRSSDGDFSYDLAYRERRALAAPAGVAFTLLGGARYRLMLPVALAPAGDVALVVSAGRDGQGPTSWYGSPPKASR
jgi:hypothetical protein